MEPIRRGELKNHIDWAKVEFLNTGEIVELDTKEDSVCHFFDPFEHENDRIVLRLDWSDPDAHGNPSLDADFYDKNTNRKRRLKGERKEVHHTPTTNPGERIYCWQFNGYKESFKVMIGWLLSATASVGVSCSAEIEVVKGKENQS